MKYFLRLTYAFCLIANFYIFATKPIPIQANSIPINISCRESLLQGSYVLIIQNISNNDLKLWLKGKNKTTDFLLRARKTQEFGWAQGFKFDANNQFSIGSDGFDTIHQSMPEKELSPWRIGFGNGGISISLSREYLQTKLTKNIKLPIRKANKILTIELQQPPTIILKENSERIYADVTFYTKYFNNILTVPINTTVSFIPVYINTSGQLWASQINLEKINMNGLSNDALNNVKQSVNLMLQELFSDHIIYQIEKKWLLNIAKVLNLRTKVEDGRLEILIL